jgi:phosphoribosylglycinamide formyltransferase-1
MQMKRIAIFASGSGTNAENLVRHFRTRPTAEIDLILSNRSGAGVLDRARSLGVESLTFTRQDFYESNKVLLWLEERSIDFIVLAGFLWLVPASLIEAYPRRMVNIHPALLPRYGGKGMYGQHVHRAVIDNQEKESGITIHYVNQAYDEGDILFQARCPVLKNDTPESLAGRIHALEYEHFPKVVESLLHKL